MVGEGREEIYIYIIMTDLRCCTAEIKTIL